MAWRSLHHVLNSFDQQPTWQQRQQFQRILARWPEAVGPVVAAQTKPIALQRDWLQVATSSPVWAQNLMFERQRILDKLNGQLPFAIKDIRFSTAHWYNGGAETITSESQRIWEQHPSRMTGKVGSKGPGNHPPTDPTTAFQHWAERMRSRSQHLPLCPACRCPVPSGELERWSVCSLCAAKAWAPSEAPPSPEGSSQPQTEKP